MEQDRRRPGVELDRKSPAGRRSSHGSQGGGLSRLVFPKADEIVEGTLIGDYRVEGKLDEGGMGTVYRGVHPVIGKKVAIKVLHPHVATQELAVARFIQEARAVNAIRHPSIVDIFGFGKHTDGRHYIVMEFLDGQHLLDFIERHGPLEPELLCSLVHRIAEPLAAAHAKGVVHRDLKPENVFLLQQDRPSWPPPVKLLDFGLAKLVEKQLQSGPQTRTGSTVGTPYYMAPEQCRGRPVDARTDVYALGVMMYEMLTGRVPFYAEAAVDVLYMHLNMDPEPPSVFAEVPQPLERLVLDCMRKPADLRPQSMNAVVARLEAVERELSQSSPAAQVSFEDLVVQTAELLAGSASDEDKAQASEQEDHRARTRFGQDLPSVQPSTVDQDASEGGPQQGGSRRSLDAEAEKEARELEVPEITQQVEIPVSMRKPQDGARKMLPFAVGVLLGVAAGAALAYLMFRVL